PRLQSANKIKRVQIARRLIVAADRCEKFGDSFELARRPLISQIGSLCRILTGAASFKLSQQSRGLLVIAFVREHTEQTADRIEIGRAGSHSLLQRATHDAVSSKAPQQFVIIIRDGSWPICI